MVMLVEPAAGAALDDPTRPPTLRDAKQRPAPMKRPPVTRWVLSSTLVSSGRRSAVINNRVVGRGDRINGAVVVDIQPASVRLRSRGREITLVMLKKNIKTPSRITPPSR